MDGVMTWGLYFSREFLKRVAARNDPKCQRGWHGRYAERTKRDFDELRPWLPKGNNRVIDIGCGFGGIDARLAGFDPDGFSHEDFFTDILLIDGDTHGPRAAGFHSQTAPWNDVKLAAEFVRDNVQPYDCEITIAAVPPIPKPWPTDLIISLKSWGHHYPVVEYLDFARQSLKPGGRLILDVRKNTDGRAQLEAAGFIPLGRAGGTNKCDRLVFRGPA